MRRLFVGNLAWTTNDDDLFRAFDGIGNVVDAKVLVDRDTGRSRGFGFVTFATDADAERALRDGNGLALNGRPLRVNHAEERQPQVVRRPAR